MGDEEVLRWWVGLVRESAADMHRGAWAIDPGGRRKHVSDHWHTQGAHELAAAGVPMLGVARQRDLRVRRPRLSRTAAPQPAC